MSVFNMTVTVLHTFFRERLELVAENLALRQQLAVQQRGRKRPKLRRGDRIFWVWLSRLWINWRSAVLIVKPDSATITASSAGRSLSGGQRRKRMGLIYTVAEGFGTRVNSPIVNGLREETSEDERLARPRRIELRLQG